MTRDIDDNFPTAPDRTTEKIPDISSNNIKESITSINDVFDERYRTLLEQVSDGVYETDIHGNFIFFNKAFCKILGYSKNEIQGKNFNLFMDNTNTRKAYEAFTKIWVTHRGFSDLILEFIDKEGRSRIIELSAYLIKDKSGIKKGFRGTARDVTQKIHTIEALKKSELRYQQESRASRRAEKMTRTLLDFVPYPMVVSSLEGKVVYINPAFTSTFGWALDELRGKHIPYVPPDLETEAKSSNDILLRDKFHRFETRRLTKDGRLLDVIMRGSVYSEDKDSNGGLVIIFRNITQEKKLKLTNETLFRISMALPEYPVLEDLLDYISREIKRLFNTDSAVVLILDEAKDEIFFIGAGFEDSDTQNRVKKIRFPVAKSMTGRVIKTGKPVIIPDTSKEPDFYSGVDQQANIKTKSILIVPLRSKERIIGALSAVNKKEGMFDDTDLELLSMIAGTVALSIENARYSDELREAYTEVSSLNRAKDKVINHLSHELKTPVSVLLASLNILAKKLEQIPHETWSGTLNRARRNLDRILDIQYEVEDIMQNRDYRAYHLLTLLLNECADELEALAADELGEGIIVERLRDRIEEIFGPSESVSSEINIGSFLEKQIDLLKDEFSHRDIDIVTDIDDTSVAKLPEDVFRKVIRGLIRNAVENCPDKGKIEIAIKKRGKGSELVVRDFGVGITEESQRRIFEGFFTTRETINYSSKRPYDFNAGGKGADLLRMMIFSERYNFKIRMGSVRCKYIPQEKDICPGNIDKCGFCKSKEDCLESGGTTFTLFFPE
jgi:PAS domain S-box-containing protein